MAYIGIKPAESFTSFATQTFSTSATSSYTLDHAVTNENELALFINNVRQQPGSGKAYTATGTALTLSANTASTDTMYAIFLGRALQTVNPADGSVATASIAATAVTGAKLNTDTISAQTALTAEPADTDEFLVSDAGVIKRIDYSLIKGGGTHVLLQTQTVSSAVSEVDFTSNIDSTYKRYMLHIIDLQPATNAAHLYMRFFADGGIGILTGSQYSYTMIFHGSDDGSATFGTRHKSSGAAFVKLADEVGSSGDEMLNGTVQIFNPASTANDYRGHSLCVSSRGDNATEMQGAFRYDRYGGGLSGDENQALNGIRFYMSSGNISAGIFKLYGIT